MPTPRKQQISLLATKYYHCISRCVRRAFLCGEDQQTGKSYEHRKQWVEDKILQLAEVFCIDICAYAIMSNHLHLVLHIDDEKTRKISDKEVLLRWHSLYKGTLLTQAFLAGDKLNEIQKLSLNETISIYRNRLSDISWFMRNLNENISRRANKEDKCTGKFWEGRFKSQALLDEPALLACMAYVDLNPIRAQIADTPEKSDHTSIKKRIAFGKKGKQPKFLSPFATEQKPKANELPFDFKSYLELVDATGRYMHTEKGIIHNKLPILERVDISLENWMKLARKFTQVLHGPVGREKALQNYCNHLKLRRRATLTQCQRLLA